MTHTRHCHNRYCKPKIAGRRQLPKRSISSLFGKIALELGAAAERQLDEAFADAQKNGRLPHWLTGWERQEKYSPADKHGVDFVFMTDIGKILIQVKSSEANAREFRWEHTGSGIRVVVVDIRDSYLKTFGKAMKEIADEHAKTVA